MTWRILAPSKALIVFTQTIISISYSSNFSFKAENKTKWSNENTSSSRVCDLGWSLSTCQLQVEDI